MEVYMFKPEEYERLYNCTAYDIESVPLQQRQNAFVGQMFILMFIFYEVLTETFKVSGIPVFRS